MGATEVDRIGRDDMERGREENECPLTASMITCIQLKCGNPFDLYGITFLFF